MLERLYPDCEDLSSFPHGPPDSNLLKGLLAPGPIKGAKDTTEHASISTIQCATAFTEKYPRMSTSWPVS
jgi:hypothetical protein